MRDIASHWQQAREDWGASRSGQEGRKSVELFTAIYRSQRDGAPGRFPLRSEPPAATFTVDLSGRDRGEGRSNATSSAGSLWGRCGERCSLCRPQGVALQVMPKPSPGRSHLERAHVPRP